MKWKSWESYRCYGWFVGALVPVLLFRDVTPANELRYLSIVDEALRNHSWFAFTHHGIPYADKPPLFFWWMMLGKELLGGHQLWFLSLASLVPALVIVHTLDQWSATVLDKKGRVAARMMLLTGGFFFVLAVTVRMDMLMCMFIVLALKLFYRQVTSSEPDRRARWLFPLYLFLAVFSKGPIGLLVPLGATTLFLWWTDRQSQWRDYWGWQTWSVLLAGCLLWFSAVYVEGGQPYLENLLWHQTIDRAVNAFHHREPFCFYGISLWYSLAPWALLIIGLILAAFFQQLLRSDLQRFFASVVFSTLFILSCLSSKLAIYALPAFPFMVYLALIYLEWYEQSVWLRVLFALTAVLFVWVLPVILYLAASETTTYLHHVMIYAGSLAVSVSGGVALWSHFRWHQSLKTGIGVLARGMLVGLFIGGWALPSLNAWIGYQTVCRKAQDLAAEKGTNRLAVYDMGRTENMDVWGVHPVAIVGKNDSVALSSLHHVVWMTRQRHGALFKACEQRKVGPYLVIYVK